LLPTMRLNHEHADDVLGGASSRRKRQWQDVEQDDAETKGSW